jgi:hypothetical protein
MPRGAYPGSRGCCRPPGGSNAHLFAQLRMLRVRQGHSLNCSTDEFDLTAPECSHCPLAPLDFHELSRAVGPKETGSKITLLMPESLQAQLGSQGFGVSGSFAKSELA